MPMLRKILKFGLTGTCIRCIFPVKAKASLSSRAQRRFLLIRLLFCNLDKRKGKDVFCGYAKSVFVFFVFKKGVGNEYCIGILWKPGV